MIIRPRPSFLRLFFIMRGSVVPRILPQILGLTAYSAVVVALIGRLDLDVSNFTITPFSLLGITLSIYLGFRNNAAYARWWEARHLWGQLIFEVRNIARTSEALLRDQPERRVLLMDLLAFCHFLRGQLRHVDALPDAAKFIAADAQAFVASSNRADAMIRRMGRRIGAEYQAGGLDSIGFRIMDERLHSLSAVQAGCERISTTPLPHAFTLLLLRASYLICLLLPIALAITTGWATPVFTALFAYTFFGLDALSEELEDPFGTEPNDLPLDALCRVCEISVFDALGEEAPLPLQPQHFYLS